MCPVESAQDSKALAIRCKGITSKSTPCSETNIHPCILCEKTQAAA